MRTAPQVMALIIGFSVLPAAPAAAAGKPFAACLVTDSGGIDDRSWNAEAWKGLEDAGRRSGMSISFRQSSSPDDYFFNLEGYARGRECGVIFSVGGLMAEATHQAARKYPKQRFVIVDSPSEDPNVRGLQFNVAQSAFQAGYLAAATSKTGKVATYGGLRIRPVTIFMDGFWEGVHYYNKKKHKKVRVIGWDERKPRRGLFAQSFIDLAKGKSITKKLIRQGADVIFPVAGGTGIGTAAAASEAGRKVAVIWADTDGCVSVPQYCATFLTGATKNLRLAVRVAALSAEKGGPTGSGRIGTLANGGTRLAPFHRRAEQVGKKTRKELTAIGRAIADGRIKITSRSQPKL